MVISMVGLVILVVSNSASNVKKIGTSGISSGGDGIVKFFCISLSIRGFRELNPHIHTSFVGDIRVCSSDKKNSESSSRKGERIQGEH